MTYQKCGGRAMDFNKAALMMHESNKGKISVESKVTIETREDLSIAYTPGVAEPCRKIAEDKEAVYQYTAKGNLVAVVSDGTAVLGLGNIGPEASMPVMEGKSILFKQFGGVDALPICLDVHDTEAIIQVVKAIAPTFGGINLEDIASPQCFEIERRLEEELDIPVFHDDQHGTAIVVTAGVMNAVRLLGKNLSDLKIVLNGPGAAGTAIIKMLLYVGVKNIIACDQNGILDSTRDYGHETHKVMLCQETNPEGVKGGLKEALEGADVFIGVSVAGALKKEMIETMAKDPIVFAMANPIPEIMYDEAIAAGVRVMGTGRSDFPNQINNVLAFPGVFKGALRVGAREINYDMKVAAAQAIANIITDEELTPEYIIPSIFDRRVTDEVAKEVEQAAIRSGALRNKKA